MVELEGPEGGDAVALQLGQICVVSGVAALLQLRDVDAVELGVAHHVARCEFRIVDLGVAGADAYDVEVGLAEGLLIDLAVAVGVIVGFVIFADQRLVDFIGGAGGIRCGEAPGVVLCQEVADAVAGLAAGNRWGGFTCGHGVFDQDFVEVCDFYGQVGPFAPGPGVLADFACADAAGGLFEVVTGLRLFDGERASLEGDGGRGIVAGDRSRNAEPAQQDAVGACALFSRVSHGSAAGRLVGIDRGPLQCVISHEAGDRVGIRGKGVGGGDGLVGRLSDDVSGDRFDDQIGISNDVYRHRAGHVLVRIGELGNIQTC